MSIKVIARSPRRRFPLIELVALGVGLVLFVMGALRHLNAEKTIDPNVAAPKPQPEVLASATRTAGAGAESAEPAEKVAEKPAAKFEPESQPTAVIHPPRVVRTRSGKNILFYEESHALVIGISDYSNPALPDLPGVQDDIERVSDALKLHGFNVRKVHNPSRDELELEYKNFVNEYGQDPNRKHNRLFFYYAGHGLNLPVAGGEENGYLIGRDAPDFDSDPQGFRRESYPLDEIHDLSKEILTKHALFIFDSCFSGSLFTQTRSVIPKEVEEKMAMDVRQYITSGSDDEEVPDDSIFCDLLVNALTDGSADHFSPDGYMTGSDLSRYLADTVKEKSGGTQTPQYGKDPREYLAKGDFVFTLNPDLVDEGKIETIRKEKKELGKWSNVKGRPKGIIAKEIPRPGSNAGEKIGAPGLEYENSLGMSFRRLNPSHFKVTASSVAEESGALKEGRIEFEEAIWLGQYEVRQEIYELLLGENPSAIKDPLRPVTNVSWKEAVYFCQLLNENEKEVGTLPEDLEYRLPWEAEWELANFGREGVSRKDEFSGDEWWRGAIEPEKLRSVGRGAGNTRGFYDLEENVLEWCGDAFMPGIPAEMQTDPRGPFSAETQVIRGASLSGASVRIGAFDSYMRAPYLGFRVALARKEPEVDRDVPQGKDFYQLSQLFTGTEYEKSEVSLKKFVLEIAQRRMQQHGYYEGKPDGDTGADTQTAINDFQWVHRLAVTGKIDTPTIERLKLAGITSDDVKKGADAYIQRTGGGGSSSGGGSNSTSDRVADEILKWSRLKGAVGGGRGFPVPFR